MLRRALFLDTLDAVRAVPGLDGIIACEPAEACQEMRDLVGPAIDVIAQRGDDLGERMTHALQDVFRLGYANVVLIGSDLPDLPPRLVEAAVSKLQARTTDIVLGPAIDGGYYLIGMNRLFSSMFEAIDWSSDRVLDQTLATAAAEGLVVDQLDPWPDVDTPADLDRLIAHSGASAARLYPRLGRRTPSLQMMQRHVIPRVAQACLSGQLRPVPGLFRPVFSSNRVVGEKAA